MVMRLTPLRASTAHDDITLILRIVCSACVAAFDIHGRTALYNRLCKKGGLAVMFTSCRQVEDCAHQLHCIYLELHDGYLIWTIRIRMYTLGTQHYSGQLHLTHMWQRREQLHISPYVVYSTTVE